MAIFAGSPLGVPKKLRILFSSKLWHVAYQIVGIFDGEFKYGIYFVENQNFEKILDQKFKKIQNFGNSFFFKLWHAHIKLQVFSTSNLNMEPILCKNQNFEKNLDQKFGPKIQNK